MERATIIIVRCLLGGLFIFAGIEKVCDPAGFALDIDAYRLLPWQLTFIMSLYLPWLEIVTGLGVLFRRYYSGSLTIIAGLMLVFTVALISTGLRGIDISCGCFGKHFQMRGFWLLMARDVGFLIMIGFLIARDLLRGVYAKPKMLGRD